MVLDDLGARVCVLGPSNSGKSTLAAAIGRRQDLPVIHLDQLRHLPATHWQLRPDEEFVALHDSAITGDRWVIEGNYSALQPQRFERATGIILLDASTAASALRYIRRTFDRRTPRVGGISGITEHLNGDMLRYILGPTRASRRRYRQKFEAISLPKVFLPSRRSINRFYAAEGLSRFVD